MKKFELPKLGYAYNALEPYIDEQTMILHHTKHHQTYTDKFNAALENNPELQSKKAEDIIAELNKVPESIRTAVKNNGGGYINHNFFWEILKKDVKFTGKIADEINKKWGNFEAFKKEFSDAALTQFGSGWAWLVKDKTGKLQIIKTANQDSPLSQGLTPLMCIDVWEHAYYLKYQNRRAEYIENFFKVINWEKVNAHMNN